LMLSGYWVIFSFKVPWFLDFVVWIFYSYYDSFFELLQGFIPFLLDLTTKSVVFYGRFVFLKSTDIISSCSMNFCSFYIFPKDSSLSSRYSDNLLFPSYVYLKVYLSSTSNLKVLLVSFLKETYSFSSISFIPDK
jgi:hypothetical protein